MRAALAEARDNKSNQPILDASRAAIKIDELENKLAESEAMSRDKVAELDGECTKLRALLGNKISLFWM